MNNKSDSILIIGGCGTFGLSTAWHLSKRGYNNIVCLDRWPFPSRSSAGYDRNKIVRTAYADPMYVKLAQEALEEWKTPIFKDVINLSGWVAGTSDAKPAPLPEEKDQSEDTSISAVGAFDRLLQNLQLYSQPEHLTLLHTPSDLHNLFPKYFSHTPGFRGVLDSNAGWVDAAKALEVVGKLCESSGVKFISGPRGTAVSLVRAVEDDLKSEVIGVKTEDGTVFKADKIICCLGAYTDSLLDMEGQLTAVAYSTTHIQLTPEELEEYRNMPVILVEGLGYTFPPDADGRLKFCDLHVGHPWMRTVNGRSNPVSIPRDAAYHESDSLPEEDIKEVREFIKYCMPQFSEREFFQTKMLWDTESFDFGWIIDSHPSSPSRLYVATGGSGHSFKNLPNVGKYVADMLEGNLSEEHKSAWRWRPDKLDSIPAIKRVDLSTLHGWKHDSD